MGRHFDFQELGKGVTHVSGKPADGVVSVTGNDITMHAEREIETVTPTNPEFNFNNEM